MGCGCYSARHAAFLDGLNEQLQIQHKFLAYVLNGLLYVVKWILESKIYVELVNFGQQLLKVRLGRVCRDEKLCSCDFKPK